jgi:hypothetical protein
MPLINYNKIPRLLGSKLLWESAHGRRGFKIRNYDDGNYVYIEFLQGSNFKTYSLEKLLSKSIIQQIQSEKLILVLCHAQHGYHNCIDELYRYIVLHSKIPPRQILLLSNSPDILTEIKYVSEKYNQKQIRAEFMVEFEQEAYYILQETPYHNKTLEDKPYSKKFLSFNGLPREHRTAVVSLLKINNLLEYGYVSFTVRTHDGVTLTYDGLLNCFYTENHITSIFKENESLISNIEPMYLDTTKENHHLAHPLGITDSHMPLYQDTYFSLITETAAYQRYSDDGFTGAGRILSEKTFKAIINCHPFILVAMPGALELLKSLGYKTFSPWINEDYDTEANDATRTLMIIEEVKKLCNLSTTELTEFLAFAKPIVEYNYQLLLEKTNWLYPLN